MLDIKFIRDNQDAVKKAIKDKYINLNLDELLDLDAQRKAFLTELESLSATKNRVSKEIPKLSAEEKKVKILEMQEVDAKEAEIKIKLDRILGDYERLMSIVPNLPSSETPVGANASANVPWSYWSPKLENVDPKDVAKVKEVPTKFDFEIKDHITLGKNLNLIDTEAGVKTSGFRGYYLKNEAVLMQYGLIWLALKKMKTAVFTLMTAPTLVREFALFGSGHFPFGRDEIYEIREKQYEAEFNKPIPPEVGMASRTFLAGTSEPALLAYYADKVVDEKDLPIKLCAVTPCYRSEVGSYGKDTKGIYRIHEFMKVEQVVLCKNDIEESMKWLKDLENTSREILEDLGLPYRVIINSTGDHGAGKYEMHDIETWMPSRNGYGETHSDSSLTDWQARRLNIRYRDKQGELHYVHTLNNTAIASPRILIALWENYQQKDGSIKIPKVLQKFVGKKVISNNK